MPSFCLFVKCCGDSPQAHMAVRLSARHSLDLLLLHGGHGVGVVLLGRGDRLRVALGEALEPGELGHIARSALVAAHLGEAR
eukprot:scaffold75232_cov49-Phaeocystis_antarctica.AAC.1